MVNEKVFSNIRQTIVGILLGGLISIVPFYFETKAMTEDNSLVNIKQDEEISSFQKESQKVKTELSVKFAVTETELKHLKEILLRIEQNQHELKQEIKALQNSTE